MTNYVCMYVCINYKHSMDNLINSAVREFKAEGICLQNVNYTAFNKMSNIISTLKVSKSPGFNNVPNLLRKKLPTKALKLLAIIFNNCIRLNYFPNIFKNAKVIPICKPNKPKKNPNSYRPISLLSNLGKMFERIIFANLNEFVTTNSVVAKEEFGFKKNIA